MSDLIDRQAAIDAIERNAYRHTYIDQIVDIIKELPSAQPQTEIIRCKDCLHYDGQNRCEMHDYLHFKENDFCSYAERQEE